MPKKTHSLSLHIAEPSRLVPKTEQVLAANKNRAREILTLRQAIRIKYFVSRVVSQSESSITSSESCRLVWKTLFGYSRLAIACLDSQGFRSSSPAGLLTLLLLDSLSLFVLKVNFSTKPITQLS